jgi:hypothetical protein
MLIKGHNPWVLLSGCTVTIELSLVSPGEPKPLVFAVFDRGDLRM